MSTCSMVSSHFLSRTPPQSPEHPEHPEPIQPGPGGHGLPEHRVQCQGAICSHGPGSLRQCTGCREEDSVAESVTVGDHVLDL